MGPRWKMMPIMLVVGVVALMQMIDVYCVQNGGVSQQRMKGPQSHVDNGFSYNLTPSSGQNGAYNMEVVSQYPARNSHFGIKAIGVTIVAFIAIIICGLAYYSHMPAKLGEAVPGKVGKFNRALNISTNVPDSQQELFEQVTSMLEKPVPMENERGSWNLSMLKTIFQDNTQKGDVDIANGSFHKSGKLAEMNIAEAIAVDSSTTGKDSTTDETSTTDEASTTEEASTTKRGSTTDEGSTTKIDSSTEETSTTKMDSTTEEASTTKRDSTTKEASTTKIDSTTEEASTTERDSTTSDDNDEYIIEDVVDDLTPAKTETVVAGNKNVIRDDHNGSILHDNDADSVGNHDTAISDDIPLENKDHDDTLKNPTNNKGTETSDKDEFIIEDGSYELENSVNDPSTGIEKAPSANGGDNNESVPNVDGSTNNNDDTGISDGSHTEENITVETTTKHVSLDKASSEEFIPDIIDEVCLRTAINLYGILNKIWPGMHNSMLKLGTRDAHQMPIIKASLEATQDKNCGQGFFKVETYDKKELIVFTDENYYVNKAIDIVSKPEKYCTKAAEAIVTILQKLGAYTDVHRVKNTISDSKGVRESLLEGLRLTEGAKCGQEFFFIVEEKNKIVLRYKNSNTYIKPAWKKIHHGKNCERAAKMFVKLLKKKNVQKCNCYRTQYFSPSETKELERAASWGNKLYCGYSFFTYSPFDKMSLSTYDDRDKFISAAFDEFP